MIENKTVLLTGAAGGIGSEIVRLLADEGAKLVLVDRDLKVLERVVGTIQTNRNNVKLLAADIGSASGREKVLATLEAEGGRLDILINCAGINNFGLLENTGESVIEAMININITAPILLTRQCLPLLGRSSDAHILNIGSTFGSIGYAGFVVYSTTKFAIRGFTEALRRELADTTIHVSYLAPRATKTPLNTGPVYQLNAALGVKMDDPARVAAEVSAILQQGKGVDRYLGWPEKLFVRINSVLPGVVNGSLRKQLNTIRHFAGLSDK